MPCAVSFRRAGSVARVSGSGPPLVGAPASGHHSAGFRYLEPSVLSDVAGLGGRKKGTIVFYFKTK